MTAVFAAMLAGCGAKTGLLVPDVVRADVLDATDSTDIADVPPIVDDTPSYLGTDFWAVTLPNGYLQTGNFFHFAVAIGNPNPVEVSVRIEGGQRGARVEFTVPPFATITQTLPWVRPLVQNSGQYVNCNDRPNFGVPARSAFALNGAYHVTSSAPVSAYQFNPLEFMIGDGPCAPRSYTNDASLLLPSPTLSGNYLVLGHNSFGESGSYVAIVAAGTEATTVDVTPTANVRAGDNVAASPRGAVIHRTMMPGDVLELIAEGGGDTSGYSDDLTGSVVRASGPVAVFAGVDCTNMSWPDGAIPACDHLEQQMLPEETWGLTAAVTQLRDRTIDERYMVRILSGAPANRVTFTPASAHDPVTLGRGEFVEFESSTDFVVTGSSPILVAQFMEGQDTVVGFSVGDPAMTLEVPVEQFRQRYEFVVPATYTASYINVVSRGGSQVVLDGALMTTAADPIVGTPWVVRRPRVWPGSHSLWTDDRAGIGLKVIGVAAYTSYMYPGGLNLIRR